MSGQRLIDVRKLHEYLMFEISSTDLQSFPFLTILWSTHVLSNDMENDKFSYDYMHLVTSVYSVSKTYFPVLIFYNNVAFNIWDKTLILSVCTSFAISDITVVQPLFPMWYLFTFKRGYVASKMAIPFGNYKYRSCSFWTAYQLPIITW